MLTHLVTARPLNAEAGALTPRERDSIARATRAPAMLATERLMGVRRSRTRRAWWRKLARLAR